MPLRPVVLTYGTATYLLGRQLANILRLLVGISEGISRNTLDLVDTMSDMVIQDNEMLVSYNVKNLYTSIPLGESVVTCLRPPEQDDSLAQRRDMDA